MESKPEAVKRRRGSWYSSESESLSSDRPQREKKTINYCEDKYAPHRLKNIFKSVQHSSKMHPQDIFFYLNVSYKPIAEEISSLETTEECLQHVLKFVSTDEDKLNLDKDFKWNGMFMSEIVQHYIENNPDIAWIYEFDDLDWKTASSVETLEMKAFFTNLHQRMDLPGLFFMKSSFGVHHKKEEYRGKVKRRQTRNLGEKSETVKTFFDSVATLVCPHSFMRNGCCAETLHFYIGEEKISDASLFLESRSITVHVKPDGVFTYLPETPLYYHTFDGLWGMVIEIYGASKEETLEKQDGIQSSSQSKMESPPCQAGGSNEPLEVENASTSEMGPPMAKSSRYDGIRMPNRKPDQIADQSYRNAITEYIERSLPESCRMDYTTMRKMAGQHVMQLFTQHGTKHLENNLMDETKVQSSIGMFVVNEFIYFSRLDVCPMVYNALFAEHESVYWTDRKMIFDGYDPPEVSFSNFRFDITKKNHRFALILFLKVYIYPQLLFRHQVNVECRRLRKK